MTVAIHRVSIGTLVIITVGVTIYMSWTGFSYYTTPIEERFYHNHYDWFKPSGIYGHGIGILGTGMIIFGVTIYILRKRYNFMGRFIRLKYLLEFHIFLCTLGPILILFHTSFKFGGVVSIAFWSMVAVVLSGVIGRFIYIQIPRTIEGRALTLNEVQNRLNQLTKELENDKRIDSQTSELIKNAKGINGLSPMAFVKNRRLLFLISRKLRNSEISGSDRNAILLSIKEEISLSHRINRLEAMVKLFGYWHVAHLPFAIIMLIIVLLHVIVTLVLGYTWVF